MDSHGLFRSIKILIFQIGFLLGPLLDRDTSLRVSKVETCYIAVVNNSKILMKCIELGWHFHAFNL